ncbi:MAG: hypothetical protein FJX29_08195 [Alphaproteobacteria bacterium]|nr:hypothetical protein [Alphaproteobacteria bacterium]
MFNRRYRMLTASPAITPSREPMIAITSTKASAEAAGVAKNVEPAPTMPDKIRRAAIGWLAEAVARVIVITIFVFAMYLASLTGSSVLTGGVAAAFILAGLFYGAIGVSLPDWFDLP